MPPNSRKIDAIDLIGDLKDVSPAALQETRIWLNAYRGNIPQTVADTTKILNALSRLFDLKTEYDQWEEPTSQKQSLNLVKKHTKPPKEMFQHKKSGKSKDPASLPI